MSDKYLTLQICKSGSRMVNKSHLLFVPSKIDFESTILALFDKLSLLVGFFKEFTLVVRWFLAKKLDFKNLPSLQFYDRTDITPHVLQREELLTKIYLYHVSISFYGVI